MMILFAPVLLSIVTKINRHFKLTSDFDTSINEFLIDLSSMSSQVKDMFENVNFNIVWG